MDSTTWHDVTKETGLGLYQRCRPPIRLPVQNESTPSLILWIHASLEARHRISLRKTNIFLVSNHVFKKHIPSTVLRFSPALKITQNRRHNTSNNNTTERSGVVTQMHRLTHSSINHKMDLRYVLQMVCLNKLQITQLVNTAWHNFPTYSMTKNITARSTRTR